MLTNVDITDTMEAILHQMASKRALHVAGYGRDTAQLATNSSLIKRRVWEGVGVQNRAKEGL